MIEIQLKEHQNYREIADSVWQHLCISVKEPEVFIYSKGTLLCSCSNIAISSKDSLVIGGFCGLITEIRL